jgi:general secretion pathway protein A
MNRTDLPLDLAHADTVMELPDAGGRPLYAGFFGLHQAPFSIAPDPRYLFMSERHREALAHLLYGVSGGGGFVVLTGEIGAGKTTVCRCFLEQTPRRCNVAYIFNPKLTVHELLHAVCTEFGVGCPAADETGSTKTFVDPLNEYLLRTHAVGQNNVLIIDEAQNLSADVLEQLRLLTNLETAERKLLQIILIGQPELRDMLARPDMEQLAQRVIARYHLDALSPTETRDYIQHRLMVAGYRREPVFDEKAARRVHQLSKGVPRRINLLCDRALLGAYSRSRATVDVKMVDTAADEVFVPTSGKVSGLSVKRARKSAEVEPFAPAASAVPRQTALALGAALLVTAGAVGMGWAWQHRGTSATGKVAEASAGPAATQASANTATSQVAPTSRPLSGDQLAAPAQATPAPPSSATAAMPAHAAASGVPGTWPTTSATPRADAPGGALTLSAWGTEGDAVRKLGLAWGQSWQQRDPCAAEGPTQRVYCFRSQAGLSLIRQLDRPVVLNLRDDAHPEAFVILWGMDGEQVLIEGPKGQQTWPLALVSARWRGDFVALWQAPEGYRSKILPGQKGLALDWLATRLSQLDHSAPPALPSSLKGELGARVLAFQVAQGLKADGVVGATTFMQVNRLTGINEPSLLRRGPTSPSNTSPTPPGPAHVLHP